MDTINQFSKIMAEIELDVRFLSGLNEDKAARFKALLEQIVCEWADKDYIPKRLAELFLDFFPSLEASSFMYDDANRQIILEFADQMTDLMRICVNAPNKTECRNEES